jgi:hypothetical protein
VFELTGATAVGVRLWTLESTMCPRFHVDRVTVRLVCTYVGAGTELVAHEDADRAWLGHAPQAGRDGDDPDARVVRSPECVVRAPRGALVLLKGEAWPENEGRGAVHRSPSTSSATPRLVLTIDPVGA